MNLKMTVKLDKSHLRNFGKEMIYSNAIFALANSFAEAMKEGVRRSVNLVEEFDLYDKVRVLKGDVSVIIEGKELSFSTDKIKRANKDVIVNTLCAHIREYLLSLFKEKRDPDYEDGDFLVWQRSLEISFGSEEVDKRWKEELERDERRIRRKERKALENQK